MPLSYKVQGFRSDHPLLGRISDEYKINYLARMLAGYDDETWNRLKPGRQRTYQRAAAGLLHGRQSIDALFAEWDAFERLVAENNERRRREIAPKLEESIERTKQEIRDDPRNRLPPNY